MVSESRFPSPFKTPEDYLIRQAWTEIIIKCWNPDNNEYINELRANPKQALQGNAKIDESEQKYFPLPAEPPDELKGLSETELKEKLNELTKPFGQFMMCGGWSVNDGEAWAEIIARAWNDSDFLQRLREDPKAALEQEYPRIAKSIGQFHPIAKERAPALQDVSDDELRRRLNSDEPGYFGWMLYCCR